MKKPDIGPILPKDKGERTEKGSGPGKTGYPTAYERLAPQRELLQTLIAGPKGGATSTKGAISAPKTPGSYGKNS